MNIQQRQDKIVLAEWKEVIKNITSNFNDIVIRKFRNKSIRIKNIDWDEFEVTLTKITPIMWDRYWTTFRKWL